MYLLDTDVIIWILRGRSEIVEKVSHLSTQAPLAISVITIAEIYKNIFPAEIAKTEELIYQHLIFDVNQKIAKLGGLYWQQYAKTHQTISLTDCLIAATVNLNNCTLMSLNLKHFPMHDIKKYKFD